MAWRQGCIGGCDNCFGKLLKTEAEMYTFDSRIRYSEVDSEGQLTMASLINYFQDCSTFQSEDLGLGIKPLQEQHLAWVLCFWQIEVERYPELGERVRIGTQPYELKGFLGHRNFMMMDEKGEYLAKANSLWSLLNTETGKPSPVTGEMRERYVLAPKLDMEYASRKIAVPEGGRVEDPIVVRKHHLDTNHHVNNQQFIDIAMGYLPEEFAVWQVRAEYRKQAFLDDVFVPRVISDEKKMIVTLTDEAGGTYMTAEFAGKEQS
ncbi:MAG: thioesterase [bacterium]|nr:thioesterase [bacterium]